jgi:broad specificity phosphatase PhoE
MSLTSLHLIRHGITASNARRIYMGRSQEGLSTDGRWQARELARRLQDLDLDAIYCSPLRRARETADIVAQPHRQEVLIDADIMELDLTRWQGRPADEIAAADAEAWQIWCEDPARLALPDIETFDALGERVRRFLSRVRKSHPSGSVAVVSHDGVIRMAVMEALGISWDHYRSLPLDNTSISSVEVGGSHPRLRLFNDIGHLSGAGVTGPADD